MRSQSRTTISTDHTLHRLSSAMQLLYIQPIVKLLVSRTLVSVGSLHNRRQRPWLSKDPDLFRHQMLLRRFQVQYGPYHRIVQRSLKKISDTHRIPAQSLRSTVSPWGQSAFPMRLCICLTSPALRATASVCSLGQLPQPAATWCIVPATTFSLTQQLRQWSVVSVTQSLHHPSTTTSSITTPHHCYPWCLAISIAILSLFFIDRATVIPLTSNIHFSICLSIPGVSPKVHHSIVRVSPQYRIGTSWKTDAALIQAPSGFRRDGMIIDIDRAVSSSTGWWYLVTTNRAWQWLVTVIIFMKRLFWQLWNQSTPEKFEFSGCVRILSRIWRFGSQVFFQCSTQDRVITVTGSR